MTTGADMVCHHDQRLVALSILISVLAAYAAREMAGRVNVARGRSWFAIAGGLPCWAASLRLALLILALVSPGVVAQAPVETPRTIRVVMDNAYAPYSFQSDEGKLQGILIDQWRAWEKKTGIKVEMRAMDWDEALRRMRAGEFDVIDSIVETVERQDHFDFTPPYTTVEASIYFRNAVSGIADLASLRGFPVGVKTGDQHIDKLKANGVTTVILFQNNDAIIEAAKEHTINVFVVDDPSALYLLNKRGIEAEFRHSAPIFRDQLRRAVRKQDAATLRTVSDGFAAIEPGEFRQIDEKWFGRTTNSYGRYLTYAGYAAVGAILLVGGLAGWNRTLRKKVLQRTAALGESEARFRRLLASNIVGVNFWNLQGDILDANDLFLNMLGYTREELRQGNLSWKNITPPEYVPVDEKAVGELMATGTCAPFEKEYIRKNGSRVFVLIGSTLLDAQKQTGSSFVMDITERKEAERKIGHFAELFQALAHHLLHIQEEERRHLARELHDEIGQILTAAKLNLKIIAPDVPPAVAGRLEDSIQLLDRLLQQVRQLSLDLRPPLLDELGLVPALRWLADQQAQRIGLRITFTANVEGLEMDSATRTACFRIAQEAITNAIRHAQAATVAIELRAEPDRVWLVVRDDGVGFDKDAMQQRAAHGASVGLLSMNERVALLGGELELNSAPGRGTEIRAWFPLARSGPDATFLKP